MSSPERHRRLAELFNSARERPIAERAAFLERECAGDPTLRREVEALLARDNEATGPLDRRALGTGIADPGLSTVIGKHPTTQAPVPERIGNYRVIRVLGEGGMGIVYLARQDKLDREVALKLVRPGCTDEKMLRRFEHEAEVLAQLLHPGIAQIYEVGTANLGAGPQPFFAMELVQGSPLTLYARENNLSVRLRLTLMAKVCDAVEHAHQKGVIHRDLKPGNILVTDDGQPKVLDFGVARATNADVRTTTLGTEIGQLIGTIPYMSPEQVGGDPAELDTRSDVYALGVVLFELLSGRLPYSLEHQLIHEAVRVIREEEPTRLSSIDRALRGDVETIVGHALEKDRSRRYQAASALAADLRRYLGDEPIEARPASTWYQLSKFSQRNKELVGGVAAALVLLVAGLVGTLWQAARANERAEQARRAEAGQRLLAASETAAHADADEKRRRAETITQFVQRTLLLSDPNNQGSQGLLVSDAMMRAVDELDAGSLKDQPEVEAALRGIIATILNGNSRSEDALVEAEKALAINHRLHSGDHPEVAKSLAFFAYVYQSLGRASEAEPLNEQALQMTQRLFEGDHPDVATCMNNLARVRLLLGRAAEAEPLFVQSLEMRRRLFKGDHPDVALSLTTLAQARRSLGRTAEAEPLYAEATDMSRRLFKHDDPFVATSLFNLASVRQQLGHSSDAEPLYEESLEMYKGLFKGDHPLIAGGMNGLATARVSLRRPAEAEALFLQALEMRQRFYKTDHPEVADSLNNVAYMRDVLGNGPEAEPLFVQALEMRRRLFRGDHPAVAESLNNLGGVRRSLGRTAEAEPLLLEALEMRRRIFKGDHPDIATSLNNLAAVRRSLGRVAEAEPLYAEALEMSQRLFKDDHPDVAQSLYNLASVRLSLQRAPEAEPLFQRALEMYRRLYAGDHPYVAMSLTSLARCLLDCGRIDEAFRNANDSAEMHERLYVNGHPRRAMAMSTLAMVLHKQGRAAEAREQIAHAEEMVLKFEPPTGPSAKRVLDDKKLILGD